MRMNEVGRISIDGNCIQWCITHFFNLPQVTDVQICSSIFRVGGRLLQLRVNPNGMQFQGTSGWFGVSLINFTDPCNAPLSDVLRVRIGLLGRNREEFCSSKAVRNRKWYKAEKLMQRQDFDSRTDELVENEVLRIFCVLESEKTTTNSQRNEPMSTEANDKCTSDPNKKEKNKLGPREPHEAKSEVKNESVEDEDEETGLPKGIETLLQDFKKLLFTSKDSDLTIKVEGSTFRAHRCILGARSPVFEAMLEHDMKEKATGEVKIKDVDRETFPDFLRYLYTGRISGMTSSKALLLFAAADKYQVSQLRQECLEYMRENLSVETFGEVMSLSLRHRETELTELATQFFVKNATEIVRSPSWQEFLSENVTVGNELFMRQLEASKKRSHVFKE